MMPCRYISTTPCWLAVVVFMYTRHDIDYYLGCVGGVTRSLGGCHCRRWRRMARWLRIAPGHTDGDSNAVAPSAAALSAPVEKFHIKHCCITSPRDEEYVLRTGFRYS